MHCKKYEKYNYLNVYDKKYAYGTEIPYFIGLLGMHDQKKKLLFQQINTRENLANEKAPSF
jgi:hypothetical protein